MVPGLNLRDWGLFAAVQSTATKVAIPHAVHPIGAMIGGAHPVDAHVTIFSLDLFVFGGFDAVVGGAANSGH